MPGCTSECAKKSQPELHKHSLQRPLQINLDISKRIRRPMRIIRTTSIHRQRRLPLSLFLPRLHLQNPKRPHCHYDVHILGYGVGGDTLGALPAFSFPNTTHPNQNISSTQHAMPCVTADSPAFPSEKTSQPSLASSQPHPPYFAGSQAHFPPAHETSHAPLLSSSHPGLPAHRICSTTLSRTNSIQRHSSLPVLQFLIHITKIEHPTSETPTP